MNEPNESTHYQVELTSRQVLTALVVLLICLFAAFFAGVWIGRNAEADHAALELARADTAGRASERFDFFSRTKAPEDAAGGAASAAADEPSRPLDDIGQDQGVALDGADFGPDPGDEEIDAGDLAASGARADPGALFEGDAAVDGAAELTPPEEMGRGGRHRRAAAREANPAGGAGGEDPVETASEAEAAPAPTTAPPAQRAAEPATESAAARTATRSEAGFFIQVLATADRDKANALVARLVDADFKAFLTPSDEGGRTVYRVRVGPFSDRALATRQANELKTRWGLDSWIPPGAP